jgi:transcription elongation factor GreA
MGLATPSLDRVSDRSYEITPDALKALEAELEELEGEARREMAERIKTARAWGDLKENAEYHDAKDAQAHLETKILRLQDRRRNAIVVEPGSASDGSAALGSTVVVDDDGREKTYALVGATEADPAAGRVSIEAPLGQCLLGAKPGDVVDFEAPRGTRQLRVVSVA